MKRELSLMRCFFYIMVIIFAHITTAQGIDYLSFSSLYPKSCSDCGTVAKSIFDNRVPQYVSPTHEVEILLRQCDSKKDGGTAIAEVSDMIRNNTSFISAGYSSDVAALFSPYLSHQGFPHLGVASWPIFNDKTKYPLHFSVSVPTYRCASLVSEFLFSLKWSRFALLGSDTQYSQFYMQGIKTRARQLDMRIIDEEMFPYQISLSPAGRNKIKEALVRMKNLQIYVFVTVVHQTDLPMVYDVGYELGMFGVKEYAWVGGSSSIVKFKLADVPFAKNNPQLLQGLLGIYRGCDPDPDNVAYGELKANSGKETPSTTSCYVQDALVGSLRAANQTIAFLRKYELPIQCLESSYYHSNTDICKKNNFEERVMSELKILGLKCDSYPKVCTLCGICEVLARRMDGNIQQGQNIHWIQLLQAGYLYDLDFQGASGHVVLSKQHGGRTLSGLKYYVYNWIDQSLVQSGAVETKVIQANEMFSLNLNQKLIFPGGSVLQPNMIAASDSPEVVLIESSLASRIIWIVLWGLGIVLYSFTLLLFIYRRKDLVIKTSSLDLMSLIMTGCMLQISVVLVVNIFPVLNSTLCMTTHWLRHLGFVLIFIPIACKNMRILHVFDPNRKGKQGSKLFLGKSLRAIVFGCCFLMTLYLIIWTIFGTNTTQVVVDTQILGDFHTVYCVRSWWEYALFIVEFLLVFYVTILSYHTKTIPSVFKESQAICFVVYNWIIILAFTETVYALTKNLTVFITVTCLREITLTFVVVIAFFFYKFYLIYNGEGVNSHESPKTQSNSVNTFPSSNKNVSSSMQMPGGLLSSNSMIFNSSVPNKEALKRAISVPDTSCISVSMIRSSRPSTWDKSSMIMPVCPTNLSQRQIDFIEAHS